MSPGIAEADQGGTITTAVGVTDHLVAAADLSALDQADVTVDAKGGLMSGAQAESGPTARAAESSVTIRVAGAAAARMQPNIPHGARPNGSPTMMTATQPSQTKLRID